MNREMNSSVYSLVFLCGRQLTLSSSVHRGDCATRFKWSKNHSCRWFKSAISHDLVSRLRLRASSHSLLHLFLKTTRVAPHSTRNQWNVKPKRFCQCWKLTLATWIDCVDPCSWRQSCKNAISICPSTKTSIIRDRPHGHLCYKRCPRSARSERKETDGEESVGVRFSAHFVLMGSPSPCGGRHRL